MKKNWKKLLIVVIVSIAGYFGYDLVLTDKEVPPTEQIEITK